MSPEHSEQALDSFFKSKSNEKNIFCNLDWSSSRPLGDRWADKRHGFLRTVFYPSADIPRYPTKSLNRMSKRHPHRRRRPQLEGGSKMTSLSRQYFLVFHES